MTFVSLRLMTLPTGREGDAPGLAAALHAAAAALPGVLSSWAAPVAAGVTINAGHLVWRATFASEGDALAAPHREEWRTSIAPLLAQGQLLALGYRLTRAVVRAPGPGIWRALIFRIMPHASPSLIGALEAHTLLMPRHVRSIRSWGFNPVAHGDGVKAFTHIWEQEFDSTANLTGEYMRHPIHWGLVDAYFDADCPEYIVDPYLIQVVGGIDRTIIR